MDIQGDIRALFIIVILFFLLGLLLLISPQTVLKLQADINGKLMGVKIKWSKKTLLWYRIMGIIFIAITLIISFMMFVNLPFI